MLPAASIPQLACLSDLSNAVLMVAQTDVVSLWSASRIHAFLDEGAGHNRLRMVLNRYKKIPGFSDEDVEHSTRLQSAVEAFRMLFMRFLPPSIMARL